MLGLDDLTARNNQQQAEYVLRQYEKLRQVDPAAVINMLGFRTTELPGNYMVPLSSYAVPYLAILEGVSLAWSEKQIVVWWNGNSFNLAACANHSSVARRLAERYGQPVFYAKDGEIVDV